MAATFPELQQDEFTRLRDFVARSLGIHLVDAKRSMVEQRLRSLVTSEGYPSFGALIVDLEARKRPSLETEFINRITTNHTFFHREPDHFKFLVDTALPEHVEFVGAGPKRLGMWCAAASRGHEPYTLAMLQRRFFGERYGAWDAGLLATDISEQALRHAAIGRYPVEEVSALPEPLRRFFRDAGKGELEVLPELKRDVVYRRFNLHAEVYPFKRPFDVVFCRNVLIYFDGPTKVDVARKIAGKLRPGGYLFVGLSESLGRDLPEYSYVRPGVYRRVASP